MNSIDNEGKQEKKNKGKPKTKQQQIEIRLKKNVYNFPDQANISITIFWRESLA